MRKFLMLFGLTATLLSVLSAQEPRPLYPDGPKNDNGLKCADEREDKQSRALFGAAHADYFLFLPEKAKATGQAVIICPGGGYTALAYGHEGIDVARWMNERGIAAVVLRYRMPNLHPEIPLSDVHEMFRVVRRNAAQWGIDPQNVGVMGFSSGGHLASTAATHFDAETRPDFAVLIYAATVFGGPYADPETQDNLLGKDPDPALIEYYSNEKHVTPQTPRTFLACSYDDNCGVPPQNSTLFFNAMQVSGVPAEIHVFPTGGHGWGWNEDFRYHDELMTSLDRWLKGY